MKKEKLTTGVLTKGAILNFISKVKKYAPKEDMILVIPKKMMKKVRSINKSY